MKKLTVLTLLLTTLQITLVQAAQESKFQYEPEPIIPFDQHVDKMVTALPDMVQTFTFLQEQGLVDTSFRQFIQTRLVRDDIENNDKQDANFGEVLGQAQDLITENMKNRFISILENIIEEKRNREILKDSILLTALLKNEQEINFGDGLEEWPDIITENMQSESISTLDSTIEKQKPLDQVDDPIFMFVMQHKDDFMYGMVNLWLYEWSNIKDRWEQVPLHKAVYDNNSEITQMLINAGADLNYQKNYKEWTPLHEAVWCKYPEIVCLLINAGANVNLTNIQNETPLHFATLVNNENIVETLINAGASVSSRNDYGQTPLYWAINRSNIKIIHMLIDAGADINIQDNNGNSSLHDAAEHYNAEIVNILMSVGTDINFKNNDGQIPLHKAVFYKKSNIHTVRLLIDAGASINMQDNDGNSPLHEASQFNNPDVVKTLIDAGAYVNMQNNYGKTPLFYVLSNSIEIINMLIDAGSDIHIQDNFGNSSLHDAAHNRNDDPKAIAMLIDAGANINLKENFGLTPLHIAVLYQKPRIARLLIDLGADMKIQDNDGFVAEQRAHTIEMQEIFEYARQKQEVRLMAIFENQLKKDWR